MVSTINKKHSISGVIDLKQARIDRNLKKLAELVNSSSEIKNRTMEYLKMTKSNAERQAEYKIRAKAEKKNINYFISSLAYQALTDRADERGKTKVEALESLLLSNNSLLGNNTLQNEFERLKTQFETIKLERNRYKSRAETAETALQDENRGIKQELQRERKEAVRLLKENAKLKMQLEKLTKKA